MMTRMRCWVVVLMTSVWLLGVVMVQAQDTTCDIDLSAVQLALEDAQQVADDGDAIEAVQAIMSIQQDLDTLINACYENLYAGWKQYISPDYMMGFRYPPDLSVADSGADGVMLMNAFEDMGVIVGVVGEDNLEDMTSFEDILTEVGRSFVEDNTPPMMIEINGRAAGRFLVDNADGVGVVDVINHLDSDQPSVIFIAMMTESQSQESLLPLIDLISASVQYPGPIQIVQETATETEFQAISGWRYALNTETNTLVAYQLDGETQDILTDVTHVQVLSALGNEHYLIRASNDTEESRYILSPDDVQAVLVDYDQFERVTKQRGDFALFVTPRGTEAGILNILTGEFSLLTGRTNFSCCAFSADGASIRYISTETPEDDENTIWVLRERDLQSSEEQVLFTFDTFQGNPFPSIVPDEDGEHWLAMERNRETETATTSLYSLDGSQHLLEEKPSREASQWFFFENMLYQFDPRCETECYLAFFDSMGNPTLTYPAPSGLRLILNQLSDDRLLVMGSGDDFYILRPDTESLALGFASIRYFLESASPDGHWAMLADMKDDPMNYVIWDVQGEQVIRTLSADTFRNPGQVYYSPNGQVWRFGGSRDIASVLFNHISQQVTTLPLAEERNYFELLPDGSVLYMGLTEDSGSAGIYRFNPINEESIEVLSDSYRTVSMPNRR